MRPELCPPPRAPPGLLPPRRPLLGLPADSRPLPLLASCRTAPCCCCATTGRQPRPFVLLLLLVWEDQSTPGFRQRPDQSCRILPPPRGCGVAGQYPGGCCDPARPQPQQGRAGSFRVPGTVRPDIPHAGVPAPPAARCRYRIPIRRLVGPPTGGRLVVRAEGRLSSCPGARSICCPSCACDAARSVRRVSRSGITGAAHIRAGCSELRADFPALNRGGRGIPGQGACGPVRLLSAGAAGEGLPAVRLMLLRPTAAVGAGGGLSALPSTRRLHLRAPGGRLVVLAHPIGVPRPRPCPPPRPGPLLAAR